MANKRESNSPQSLEAQKTTKSSYNLQRKNSSSIKTKENEENLDTSLFEGNESYSTKDLTSQSKPFNPYYVGQHPGEDEGDEESEEDEDDEDDEDDEESEEDEDEEDGEEEEMSSSKNSSPSTLKYGQDHLISDKTYQERNNAHEYTRGRTNQLKKSPEDQKFVASQSNDYRNPQKGPKKKS